MRTIDVHNPIEVNQPALTVRRLQARAAVECGHPPRTVAGAKGYHTNCFAKHGREMGVRPHVAQVEKRRVKGLHRRTTRTLWYKFNQRIRKQSVERVGWSKVVGGLQRTMYCDGDKVAVWSSFIGSACNHILMSRLAHAQTSSA